MRINYINSAVDLILIIEEYYEILNGKIEFDQRGWPIFKKDYFLKDWPKSMVDYDHRNSKKIIDKTETVLCFYEADERIYPRFIKIEEEIKLYKQYKGVVFPDITITEDMDIELQELIMLANQLFATILAVNGVKLVLNTRCGSTLSQRNFMNIPRHTICASGFLGCSNAKTNEEVSQYVNKILSLLPEKLLIYGKEDKQINKQLDILGMNYRYYPDFHRLSKRGGKNNVRL